MDFSVRWAIISKHWSASSRSATGGGFSWLKNPFLFLCLQFLFYYYQSQKLDLGLEHEWPPAMSTLKCASR